MSCSLHDMAQIERLGIPTATICTSGFVDAGMKQATMLGIPSLPIVAIPFPFASLPPEQARLRGAEAFDPIVAALTSSPH